MFRRIRYHFETCYLVQASGSGGKAAAAAGSTWQPSSGFEIKNTSSFTSTPTRLHGVVLRHRGYFTLVEYNFSKRNEYTRECNGFIDDWERAVSNRYLWDIWMELDVLGVVGMKSLIKFLKTWSADIHRYLSFTEFTLVQHTERFADPLFSRARQIRL
jgi:hypothetical protein